MTTYSTKYTYIVADKFSKTLDKFNKKIAFSAKGVEATSKKMNSLGLTMGMKFTAPLGLAIYKLKNFSQTMNEVQAYSGATAVQFKELRKQAILLGGSTKFTSLQVGEAQKFLAKSLPGMGDSAKKVKDIVGSLKPTLNLAAAANLDMGSSANIVTNIMSGMALTIEDLPYAVDVLTNTFVSSNTDLMQLGESFKYAGPVVKQYGLDINETAAALGFLGSAGIQGSMAGTSLKNTITRLMSPTKKMDSILKKYNIQTVDSVGNFKKLDVILGEIHKKKVKAGEVIELFGLRGGPSMLALLGKNMKEYSEFLKTRGTAAKIAKIQMQGEYGALVRLSSAFDNLIQGIGDAGLSDMIIGISNALRGLTVWIIDLPAPMKTIIAVTFGLLGVMGPLLITVGQLGFGAVFLSKGMIFLGNTSLILRARLFLLQFSMWQITLTLGAIAVAVYAVYKVWQEWDNISPEMKSLYYAALALATGIWLVNAAFLANPIVWIIGAIIIGIGAVAFGIYNLINAWNYFKEAGVPDWMSWVYDKFVAIYDLISKIGNIKIPFTFNPEELGQRAGESVSRFIGDSVDTISNLFSGGGGKSEVVHTFNMNDPNGAVKSVESQSYGNYKPAVNF